MRVVKELDFGIYLDGDDFGEILMPLRYVPKNTAPDDEIDCFVYLDSEDRYIATTERPKAMVGEFALLKADEINNIGAFLDWGLPKDLLVPYSEQKAKMEEGRYYVVYIYMLYVSCSWVGWKCAGYILRSHRRCLASLIFYFHSAT